MDMAYGILGSVFRSGENLMKNKKFYCIIFSCYVYVSILVYIVVQNFFFLVIKMLVYFNVYVFIGFRYTFFVSQIMRFVDFYVVLVDNLFYYLFCYVFRVLNMLVKIFRVENEFFLYFKRIFLLNSDSIMYFLNVLIFMIYFKINVVEDSNEIKLQNLDKFYLLIFF